MVWDCLIGWVILVFTLMGWSMGLVRSWAVPFAMAIGTYVTQHIYVDVATVMVETLHLEPAFAVFAGYFLTWLGLVQYAEAFLQRMIHTRERTPIFISKVGGGILGFSKGAAAFVFAAMVAYAQNQVPEPPVLSWQNSWMLRAAEDSKLLPKLHLAAAKLDQPLGKYVLSDAAPRFHANFSLGDDPFAAIEKRQRDKGLKFVQGWKKFQKDTGFDF